MEHGYQGVEWRVTEVRAGPLPAGMPVFWPANCCTTNVDILLDQAETIRDLGRGTGPEICNLATYVAASAMARSAEYFAKPLA